MIFWKTLNLLLIIVIHSIKQITVQTIILNYDQNDLISNEDKSSNNSLLHILLEV